MLISVLSLVTLSLLEIRLDYTLKKDTLNIRPIGDNSWEDVEEPDPVGDYLESMDMGSFALQIAHRIPTLGHIGVKISCVKDSQTYWKVIRSPESDQVSVSNVASFQDGHEQFWQLPKEMEE